MKLKSEIMRGSMILLIAFGLFNLLNFVFHLSMARLLTVSEFGVLSALFSIIYIAGIFSESIQLIVSKYSTQEKDLGRIKNLAKKSIKKSLKISFILFIGYLLLSIPLSYFLRIDYLLLSINGLIILAAFLMPITRGILQGKKKFRHFGANMIVESGIKLIAAIVLVLAGLKVYGAIIGTLIGAFSAFFLSFLSMEGVLKSKEKKAKTQPIYSYAKPSFFIIFSILAFYSLDVLIARIFFSAEVAGAYAIASILAKIIFLGTQPISRAMFPLSSDNDKSKKAVNKVFANAFLFLIILIIIALLIVFFFPELLVFLFSGRLIVESISVLFILSLATSLLSITNLVLLYKLSIGKTKNYQFLLFFLVIEILLLSIFSGNLIEYSIAFLVSSAAFLWGVVFLFKEK